MSASGIQREYFQALVDRTLRSRGRGEHFFFTLTGEESQFIRVNASQVRQIGTVSDALLEITLVLESGPSAEPGLRRASRSLTLSGLSWRDFEELDLALATLRNETPQLPLDPFAELPRDHGSNSTETRGELLPLESAVDSLLEKEATSGLDIAGIYAAGPAYRGMANSAGQTLWFSTETFSFDYSVYTTGERALKGIYAGKSWDTDAFRENLARARSMLPALQRPATRLERGGYRAYLAPAAVAELVRMFSWSAIGEASLRQGDSPLRLLRARERALSPKFSLSEDFRGGEVPRFNELGELAPEHLPLIEKGELRNTLVSSRTAREYGTPSNAATEEEMLRSPNVAEGALDEQDILRALDSGIHISNLHYLNWSDQAAGRITGMTRYACFQVENGRITAPIENMRWDDSLFSLFGDALSELTRQRAYLPDIHTYERRGLGGVLTPGLLLSRLTFTI